MANALYPKAKEKLFRGLIDTDVQVFKIALLNTFATYDSAAEFWSSLSSHLVGTALPLSGVTVTNGVFDANDVLFEDVTGLVVGSAVIYQDTGSASTSPLILWLDTDTSGPLILTPSGGYVEFVWDDGPNKIFAL